MGRPSEKRILCVSPFPLAGSLASGRAPTAIELLDTGALLLDQHTTFWVIALDGGLLCPAKCPRRPGRPPSARRNTSAGALPVRVRRNCSAGPRHWGLRTRDGIRGTWPPIQLGEVIQDKYCSRLWFLNTWQHYTTPIPGMFSNCRFMLLLELC
jgi:hypothetical protein